MPATDISSQTLHIVAKELAGTLNEARAALEIYADRPDQSAALERCAGHLHSAHGALRMVEVYGAALLAEEMEHVTRYLLAAGNDQKRQIDGLDALMRAMVQLPAYLERVLSGGRDFALVLLPLLNDLRSVRGGPLLSEGTLLLLNLKSDQPAQPHPNSGADPALSIQQWARRLRPQFQVGLLGYIRGQNTVQHLEMLASVAEKLEYLATTQSLFQLWWVIGALLEAVRANGLESSATLKRLLGQADRQIKLLYELGEARYCENPPIDLLNNLLYYVARASTDGGRVAAVRASFKLAELLPVDDAIEQERENLSAPSVKLMRTVAAAIKEDLSKVKDVLDIFVRRGGGRSEELGPQLDLLKKISDTLGVLGLGELRQRIQREVVELSVMVAEGKTPSDASLIDVAGVLLAVEDSLDDELVRLILPSAAMDSHLPADSDHEFRLVSEAVLRECIVNLARVKEAVSVAVQKHAGFPPHGLDNVPQLLRGITAGLLMLGKVRAVDLMDAIGTEVRRLLEPGSAVPDSFRLEHIADAIVSIEYYMETLQNGRNDPWYMLDNAEICLKALADDTPPGVSEVSTAQVDTANLAHAIDAETMTAEQATNGQSMTYPLPVLPLSDAVDPQFLELFIEEAKEELASIQQIFPMWDHNPMDLDSLNVLRRSFHTLKGSGRMVGALPIAEFGWSIENLLNRILDNTLTRSPAIMALLRSAVAMLPHLVEELASGSPTGSAANDLMTRAFALAEGRDTETGSLEIAAAPAADAERDDVVPDPTEHADDASTPSVQPQKAMMDPQLHEIYSKETSSHLAEIRDYLEKRVEQPPPHYVPESVYRAVHTLSGSSKMAEARLGIRVTEPLNNLIRKVYDSGHGLSDSGLVALADAVREIDEVVAHINESTGYFAAQPALLARLHALESELDAQLAETPSADAQAGPASTVESGAPRAADEFDHEIAAIYSEEATELLEAAQISLGAWNRDRTNRERVADLQRQLHTLKGGARMAGIAAMGDLSHELESVVIHIDAGSVAGNDHAYRVMQSSLDELARMRDTVSAGKMPVAATALLAQIHDLESGPEPVVPDEVVLPQTPAEAGILSEESVSALDLSSVSVLPGREGVPAERVEMARVDAELLDTMLNNAGEVSIFRARLDQQINSIDFNLAELARTVIRLKEQLRGLEIETEAQVLHRHHDEEPRRDDFDPLELDRYSTLQQFSRALSETSGDVASIQGLLETLIREAQNLLTGQARVITELQNSLMRTRMVPFQRHVQRLTRLVRQAANDTGKRAELVVQGAAAELDRQMLERILAPLEHMLRNAVIHGIESPERRAAAAKPEVGRISVSLTRDGAEVVVVVNDDGAGINVKLIREKALSLALIDRNAKLTDEEAMQLILEPGFSTAGHLTQAAGRGVGMDVVATEVKKLGGGLFIESTMGQGSRFTIRLPFTLAISQALIVRVAEETYALPLATVEGVVRLPRNIVARHLGKDAPMFEYGGQKYRFQHLGSFVGLGASRLPELDVSMSVVLVRAGEHSTALVTDELVGSREIVVKSLGPQVSAIRGIAGATILGDGRIVIILDMGSLVRAEWRAKAGETQVLDQRDRRTFALVVDDSITVRRVTQRLLERNGMRVLTAKDGVDAVSLLQDNLPDIILLDIEMPRMDGYEVAAHVRNDERLKDIPIVMITSRVSEKHRARAIELGVDDYLGKPYQENQLLDAIEPLVNRRSAAVQ